MDYSALVAPTIELIRAATLFIKVYVFIAIGTVFIAILGAFINRRG